MAKGMVMPTKKPSKGKKGIADTAVEIAGGDKEPISQTDTAMVVIANKGGPVPSKKFQP